VELLRLQAGPADAAGGLEDELVARALAIAGWPGGTRRRALLPRRTVRWLDDSESWARRLADELPSTAVVDFLGDAFAALAREGLLSSVSARDTVRHIATKLGIEPSTAALAVYRRATASRHCLALPTPLATEFILTLMVDLGPADSASLWTRNQSRKTSCLAGAGPAPRSRRLRDAARAALAGVPTSSSRFQSAVVERWDRPFAILVAAGTPGETTPIRAYLTEASAALSSALEREAAFERNVASERTIVAAGERRLARLGFDLHDGPLQEIVALAESVRYARTQIATLVDAGHRERVSGCFEDLEAQLAALDRDIREIAHSIRPTTAVDRPLDNALRGELDALSRTSGIETGLSIDGDLAGLTDSQRIVIFRVVQEALANARKHSQARYVGVRIESTERVIGITVSDDGQGFDATKAPPSSRLGLAGVSERVRLLGGEVEIESVAGLGTIVRASLPQWRPSTSAGTSVYAVTA
jgi:signal transduction histidine kinase